MKNFTGKTAVVTGAASGIGFATANRFAQAGMNVVLADWEKNALKRAEAAFQREGHSVLAVHTDVSQWESVQNLATRTVDHFGGVHLVHNNAGVIVCSPLLNMTEDDFNWMVNVNMRGVFHGIKAFIPLLQESGGGHMVNTASYDGLRGKADFAGYSMTKFGIVSLSDSLLNELRATGDTSIGVSVLCPGGTRTRIVESQRNREAGEAHRTSDAERDFMGKDRSQHMEPAETAEIVFQAIQEERFWIVTWPGWEDAMRKRTDEMVGERRLPGLI